MNNNIQVFNYQDFTVRTFTDTDGEVWLVAKDVCAVLGISKYRDAIADLDEDERMSINVDTPGGKQDMAAINEPGLYKLTFRSNKPGAKEFTRKVTHEILPQINHTGSYSINDSKPVVVEQKKKGNLPAHSGGVKAGERLAQKVFKCKKPEDFQAVLAMDEDFKDAFGYSWLERHSIRLRHKFEEATYDQKHAAGLYGHQHMTIDVYYWEHSYDLDKKCNEFSYELDKRGLGNDDTVNFDEWDC